MAGKGGGGWPQPGRYSFGTGPTVGDRRSHRSYHVRRDAPQQEMVTTTEPAILFTAAVVFHGEAPSI